MPELAQDQTSNLSDIAKRIKRLEKEVRMSKARARTALRLVNESTAPAVVWLDDFETILTISGTDGDGAYTADTEIDFSIALPLTAKKAYVQMVVYGADIFAFDNKYGIKYTPDGWNYNLEWSQTKLVDVNIEDSFTIVMPLAETLIGNVSVIQISNGPGDAWSYDFKVFGYE